MPSCTSNCAAYVAGNTRSSAGSYEVTASAFQTTNPDTHMNSSGYFQVIAGDHKSLLYSTFLGGTGTNNGGESLTRLTVDAVGTVWLTGGTFSSDYPTKDPFQSSNQAFAAGAQNAVVSRLDPSGSGAGSLLYSTYVGGTGTAIPLVGSFGDIGVGIALDANQKVYITGAAASQDFPLSVTKPPFQNLNKDTFNAFVTELNPGAAKAADQLVYSTYLGGNGSGAGSFIAVGDTGNDLTVDANGLIYVTGATTSPDFPDYGHLQGTGNA